MDRHRGVVLHRLGDVVDVDVVAENLLGILVHHLDGRASESYEGRIWQPLPDVIGKAVAHLARSGVDLRLKPILTAVRLIHEDHHIAAVSQGLEVPVLGPELLDGGENHPARLPIE